ncbi:MAG: hypothetical protein KJ050_12430 [Candidatus Omnitrophica bacterium]|nr:MAG: hypothetical protein UZ16_OP3001002510 [Candidatus Hinthialibacteria bacterium OLB16]MBE7488389.1 hypothetical protein [bacterium]MBK7494836.1 hypothetical protein [Candidatus Omnitrophota bacterium]MCE7908249.1 hypothetical protein [Candidatus Omnitrophica bacterium COP1]MBV6481510.1 hypothetical protein [bacterium]
MSQEAVEVLVGKIVTDDEIRARFFRSPEETCCLLGLQLTPVELEAIRHVSQTAVRQLAVNLDPRLIRAALGNKESMMAREMDQRFRSIGSRENAPSQAERQKARLVALES